MSKAAELIAGLQSDAEFDSDGGFSLDREKAREKMRQFQLADPHRYVLLLVEAAVLRGATTIASSHLGLGHHPATVVVVADRLTQDLDNWVAFTPPRLASRLFPTG